MCLFFFEFFSHLGCYIDWASLVAQMVKNLPAMRGDPRSVPELGRSPGERNGNPLQYSCLSVPWTEEPARLQFLVLPRVRDDWATKTFFHNIEQSSPCYTIGPCCRALSHSHLLTPFCPKQVLWPSQEYTLEQGCRPLGSDDDLKWSWCNHNKVHNRFNVLELSQNHLPPPSIERLSSVKVAPGAKNVVTAALEHARPCKEEFGS